MESKYIFTLKPVPHLKSIEIIEQDGIKCNKCGKECFSKSVHDFVACDCPQDGTICFADGGLDYFRYGHHENPEDYELITRKVYKYER